MKDGLENLGEVLQFLPQLTNFALILEEDHNFNKKQIFNEITDNELEKFARGLNQTIALKSFTISIRRQITYKIVRMRVIRTKYVKGSGLVAIIQNLKELKALESLSLIIEW